MTAVQPAWSEGEVKKHQGSGQRISSFGGKDHSWQGRDGSQLAQVNLSSESINSESQVTT